MCPARTRPCTGSTAYGTAQPPWGKTPRWSSSGRPGACITPSRLTDSTALIFGICPPRGLATYTKSPRPHRHNGIMDADEQQIRELVERWVGALPAADHARAAPRGRALGD